MQIYIDVGNTNTKVGIYGENYIDSFYFATKATPSIILGTLVSHFEKYNNSDFTDIVYASVVPNVDQDFVNLMKTLFKEAKVFKLDSTSIKKYIKTSVDNPPEVGQDIVLDVYATVKKHGYPCLVVDLGTASKFILIDKNGVFSSVAIVPGIKVNSYILRDKTALLPEVTLEEATCLLDCKNTDACLKNGIVFGHLEMIKGLCERYENELGYSCKHIITGGATYYINKFLPKDFIYELRLSLDGMHYLYINEIRGK